ncbi:hypothetical protein CYMTET_3993 [Cymbomonas tetramitiformis]|uniref:Trichome birefringence-like C-terminal domain-containing protein n=1 Tax=Cymbomonas tetramitiformis TaxID=36881 RepID=A0AAE0H2B2_9CHLO|nr:hypothetical protein CYMTET_3993 [Cymbomonas tetramitiformis]
MLQVMRDNQLLTLTFLICFIELGQITDAGSPDYDPRGSSSSAPKRNSRALLVDLEGLELVEAPAYPSPPLPPFNVTELPPPPPLPPQPLGSCLLHPDGFTGTWQEHQPRELLQCPYHTHWACPAWGARSGIFSMFFEPYGCDLESLDPERFIKQMRGRTLFLAGDELSGSSMLSLVCTFSRHFRTPRAIKKLASTGFEVMRCPSSGLVISSRPIPESAPRNHAGDGALQVPQEMTHAGDAPLWWLHGNESLYEDVATISAQHEPGYWRAPLSDEENTCYQIGVLPDVFRVCGIHMLAAKDRYPGTDEMATLLKNAAARGVLVFNLGAYFSYDVAGGAARGPNSSRANNHTSDGRWPVRRESVTNRTCQEILNETAPGSHEAMPGVNAVNEAVNPVVEAAGLPVLRIWWPSLHRGADHPGDRGSSTLDDTNEVPLYDCLHLCEPSPTLQLWNQMLYNHISLYPLQEIPPGAPAPSWLLEDKQLMAQQHSALQAIQQRTAMAEAEAHSKSSAPRKGQSGSRLEGFHGRGVEVPEEDAEPSPPNLPPAPSSPVLRERRSGRPVGLSLAAMSRTSKHQEETHGAYWHPDRYAHGVRKKGG